MADAIPVSIRLRPKLSDVARLAGVGNATVSRVLNGGQNVSPETARRIEEVIRELGYKPNRAARSLKGAASGIVGMIVPSISDMFFARCAEAVEEIVRENGGMLIVAASQNSAETILESFQQLMLHQIDGLILVQSSEHDTTLAEELTRAGIPVVGIDRPLLGTPYAAVLCDNFEGARLGTTHLLEHGYETVVGVEINSQLYTMRERHKGYVEAMAGVGKKATSHVIGTAMEARDVLMGEVERSAGTLGVFAANNLTARYLLEAVTLLRLRIPHDVAMLSFDDFDLADLLQPPMSVVRQPVEDLGRQAARLLFRQMDGSGDGLGTTEKTMSLPTRLVLRGSCGCPIA